MQRSDEFIEEIDSLKELRRVFIEETERMNFLIKECEEALISLTCGGLNFNHELYCDGGWGNDKNHWFLSWEYFKKEDGFSLMVVGRITKDSSNNIFSVPLREMPLGGRVTFSKYLKNFLGSFSENYSSQLIKLFDIKD